MHCATRRRHCRPSAIASSVSERTAVPSSAGRFANAAILTYHVIPGRLTAQELSMKIDQMGGHYSVNTVQGAALSFSKMGGGIAVTDAKGDTAMVTIPDVLQSNGVPWRNALY